jgi:hypothetical protein
MVLKNTCSNVHTDAAPGRTQQKISLQGNQEIGIPAANWAIHPVLGSIRLLPLAPNKLAIWHHG